ncbi:unnamed protein product [Rodentolepis nana]|uniref:Nudix hydrolase domain-containing protein n=1 Tax=Rodentolepis nana TaxID=102285 RepID=A0A0R3TCG7_RODNA|nr:unnamed protein product [Rodentolepis nana]
MPALPELFGLANRRRCISSLNQLKTFSRSNSAVEFQSAVVVPLVSYDGVPSILYTRRSLFVHHFPGEVCFPGGKIDPGESAIEAAFRELNEEVGIPSHFVDTWTIFAPVHTRTALSLIYPIVGFVGNYHSSKEVLCRQSESIRLKLSPEETDMALFRSINWLSDPSNRWYCVQRYPPSLPASGVNVSFYDNSRKTQTYQSCIFPVFGCRDSQRITGATALLTYQFLNCLLPQGLPGNKIEFGVSHFVN